MYLKNILYPQKVISKPVRSARSCRIGIAKHSIILQQMGKLYSQFCLLKADIFLNIFFVDTNECREKNGGCKSFFLEILKIGIIGNEGKIDISGIICNSMYPGRSHVSTKINSVCNCSEIIYIKKIATILQVFSSCSWIKTRVSEPAALCSTAVPYFI